MRFSMFRRNEKHVRFVLVFTVENSHRNSCGQGVLLNILIKVHKSLPKTLLQPYLFSRPLSCLSTIQCMCEGGRAAYSGASSLTSGLYRQCASPSRRPETHAVASHNTELSFGEVNKLRTNMTNYLLNVFLLAKLVYGMLDVRNPESVELVTQLTNAFCAGKNNLEPCNEALGAFGAFLKATLIRATCAFYA